MSYLVVKQALNKPRRRNAVLPPPRDGRYTGTRADRGGALSGDSGRVERMGWCDESSNAFGLRAWALSGPFGGYVERRARAPKTAVLRSD